MAIPDISRMFGTQSRLSSIAYPGQAAVYQRNIYCRGLPRHDRGMPPNGFVYTPLSLSWRRVGCGIIREGWPPSLKRRD